MMAALNDIEYTFLDYITTYKAFLTWQQASKTINTTQPEKLYFLVYNDISSMELHIKDLQNALDTAHEVGAPIPLTSQVMEIMQALKVDGQQKDDHGGLIQFYEKLAGVKVRR